MTQHLTQRPCSRRQSLALAAASLLPALSPALARATAPGTSPAAMPAAPLPVEPLAAVAALERRVGGRLGVVVLDTGSGACVGHRADERFGMCSTFKLPLAALVLQQIDQGRWQADRWVPYTQADMTAHAPVTQAHLARGGMSVVALAQAAQTTSDNTAANLLLTLIGGPAGFTAALRAAGDKVTRLDRLEPHMNLVKPGDERDTTTPVAMARTAAHWLTGDALSTASRALLIDWMVATRTGSKRRHRHGRRYDGQVQRRGHHLAAGPGARVDQCLLRDGTGPWPHARRGPGRAGRGRATGSALGARRLSAQEVT
jgi:beta-lactamase class A